MQSIADPEENLYEEHLQQVRGMPPAVASDWRCPLMSFLSIFALDPDDFDFGGDDGEDSKLTGGKRSYGELEDDDDEIYPAKKMYASSVVANDHATTTILNLRASLEERESTIAGLQKELDAANADLERWHNTFQIESVVPLGTTPEPDVVLAALQKVRTSEGALKEQLLSSKRRESAMLVKLAGREQEIVDLKSLVNDLKLMLKPPMLQTRRLLLDPAIHAEFTRMKKELEAAEKRVKELQDDLAAVQFTPHSKNGKMLMAKCRTLQEENEEIGREASEGKMHELGTKLAMQKTLNNELRRGYQELFEYVEDLNDEVERSQQTIYILQRQLQQKENQVQQKHNQLLEQRKRADLRDTSMKSREEERVQYLLETKRDGYMEEDKLTGDLKRSSKHIWLSLLDQANWWFNTGSIRFLAKAAVQSRLASKAHPSGATKSKDLILVKGGQGSTSLTKLYGAQH
ncbi:hypothetical protein AXG93_2899s1250 [Marchantia polymorpha subsp. ruderalis]|uniref:Uncharacterized protein n=1 Tax=Marchantia polymorpha subsp. ruderalis TaxID=1480154 RepID=A0A176VE73_MARPO|nr:hypothetical protein AXG93_2899s1250 [Marchantia polymorpha subsp. ruderalis]